MTLVEFTGTFNYESKTYEYFAGTNGYDALHAMVFAPADRSRQPVICSSHSIRGPVTDWPSLLENLGKSYLDEEKSIDDPDRQISVDEIMGCDPSYSSVSMETARL